MTAPEVKSTCAGCGRTVKSRATQTGVAVPRGWRVIGGQLLCNDQQRGGVTITGCISHRYMIRSFRVEITGLAQESLNEGRTIGEFRAACSAAARESARYGNYLVQKMYAADPAASTARESWPKTKDGKPKIPPLPVVATYVPAEFPELSGAAMSALSQMVRQWYEARRAAGPFPTPRCIATSEAANKMPTRPARKEVRRKTREPLATQAVVGFTKKINRCGVIVRRHDRKAARKTARKCCSWRRFGGCRCSAPRFGVRAQQRLCQCQPQRPTCCSAPRFGVRAQLSFDCRDTQRRKNP